MSAKSKAIYLFFFAIFAFALLWASFIVRNNMSDLTFLEGKHRVSNKVLSTHFVNKGKANVSLEFDNFKSYVPNAITIKINYDPKIIKISTITIGDIWTNTNVLEKTIDNDKGVNTLSLGQGFNANATGTLTIANINFQVLNSNLLSTTFSIGSDSVFGITNVKTLMSITGKSISVNLK